LIKIIKLNLLSFLVFFDSFFPLVLKQLPDEVLISLLVQLVVVNILHIDRFVSQSVEDVVSWLWYNPPVRLLATAVIKRIPLPVKRILSKCSVMTATDSAVVIWNGVAIVNQRRILLLLFAQNEGSHVQTIKREINLYVHFLATHPHESRLIEPRRLKALQTDDHNTWHLEDFHGFGGLDVLLALVAVPHILLV